MKFNIDQRKNSNDKSRLQENKATEFMNNFLNIQSLVDCCKNLKIKNSSGNLNSDEFKSDFEGNKNEINQTNLLPIQENLIDNDVLNSEIAVEEIKIDAIEEENKVL